MPRRKVERRYPTAQMSHSQWQSIEPNSWLCVSSVRQDKDAPVGPASARTLGLMSSIYSARRHNLRALAAERGGATALGTAIGLTKGRMSQLIGSKPTGDIGEKVARRVEDQLGLPSGWLDQVPSAGLESESEEVDLRALAQSSREALQNLRANLLQLMARGSLSQRELGRRTGMTAKAISRLVAPIEEAHSPTLQTLQALAFGLNTTVAALVSPGLEAATTHVAKVRSTPSLAKQTGRLVEDFLLASEEDRRAILAQAAEAADRAARNEA